MRSMRQLFQAASVVFSTVMLLGACATEPVVRPTELSSISVESRVKNVWSRKLGNSEEGRFEPLVIDNVLYAASRIGNVLAVDEETGKQKWARDLDVKLSSGVGGAGTNVYVSTDEGLIVALNAKNGETLWEMQASSEVLVPVSAGFGSVIVRSADGRVLSLDPSTGVERWTATFRPPALTLNGYSRPLLLDGGVLVGLDDGRLIAIASNTGKVVWQSVVSVPSGRSEVERLSDIDGSIGVDETAIYAASYQGKLARIEPVQGQIVWSVPMSSTAGLAISETAIFVISDDDEVQAYDKINGELLWSQDAFKNRRLSSPAVLSTGQILVGDLEGYVHIINAEDGRVLGRNKVAKKAIFPEIIPTAERIFVQAEDGSVTALLPPQ